MSGSFIEQLLNYGSLGIFAGFLIYLYFGMQKRMDKLVESFQEQLREIDAGFENRVEIMRVRYDEVIQQYRKEANDCHEKLAQTQEGLHREMLDQIKGNTSTLENVADGIKRGLQEMGEHYLQVEIQRKARELSRKEDE